MTASHLLGECFFVFQPLPRDHAVRLLEVGARLAHGRLWGTLRGCNADVRTMPPKLARYLIVTIVVIVLSFAAWTWLALTWSYSEGERAGYVQKFSKKGWLCKTWEGEIAMVTMPGAIPEKFAFSVRDEAVAEAINRLAGQRVVLHYQQHRFVPTSCFGETEYFVVGVRAVDEDAASVPALPPRTLQLPH